MLTYIARRLLIAVPVLSGILFATFVLIRMLPGDPTRALMSPEEFARSPEYVARRRDELGLDDPILVQFVAWVRELLQGNLGYSFHRRIPVVEMLDERIWPTVLLTTTGIGIALTLGIPIGIIAALRQNSWIDYLSSALGMLAISIPTFFLGLLVIYIFAILLGILPSGGMQSLSGNGSVADVTRHLILPGIVLAAVLIGPYVRFTRQSMLEVLRQEYIITARAKGVGRLGIIIRHGLRNALTPLTTVLAIQIPSLLAGTVIIETIFSWPGVGRLVYEAILSRDYPVITAVVLMSALLVTLFNLFADVLAAILDPRIRI